ncbi:MAG TPA: hypothetical protein VD927_15220 [Chryseosolibacter sp.]|nr:hypothetical protein [Chryseosolibacter sp.]
MKQIFLLVIAALMTGSVSLFAQDRKDKAPVTYEELYDEPYSINKLFVAFQPMYGELFVTNINAGFGVEAIYFHKDKLDFRAHFRKTYTQEFYDFARDLASKNSDVDNRAEVFNYFELGGTYHIKDFEESSKTKMFLYKNSYKGNRWASRVPLSADIPCKVRKIYGARVGGIIWDSSTDLGRALEDQGLTNADLKSGDVALPTEHPNPDNNNQPEPLDVFTNVSSKGFYVGGSMSWIRNVAVSFDKFEEGVDDLILTTYLDILFSPTIGIDDIVYTDETNVTRTYSVAPVKTKTFGFRAGIDGRFNRTLSWAYGAEVGYRPSIDGSGFFAMLKISFPIYGTNLDYKVEAFGK